MKTTVPPRVNIEVDKEDGGPLAEKLKSLSDLVEELQEKEKVGIFKGYSVNEGVCLYPRQKDIHLWPEDPPKLNEINDFEILCTEGFVFTDPRQGYHFGVNFRVVKKCY